MREWTVPERTYEIPSKLALLDTCVLVAISDPEDSLHRVTLARLDEADFEPAVAHVAYIEAWNLLVGRNKNKRSASRLFAWVSTPGNALRIGEALEPFDPPNEIAQSLSLDLVDVSLAGLATRMMTEGKTTLPITVATFDTGDFLRLYGRDDLKFSIFDMNEGYLIA